MKKILIIGVLSLAISLLSPFIFKHYLEKKPAVIEETMTFGGPIPFAEQHVSLPEELNDYPTEISFQSPFNQATSIQWLPLGFTFICYFLLIISLYTVLSKYLTKPIQRKKKSDLEDKN